MFQSAIVITEIGYVKKLIQSIPVPIAGLMLGLAALGNLLSSYNMKFKAVLGIFSFAIFILLLIKIIYDNKSIAKDLQNPAIAGVACTFPMGIVLLAAYLVPFWPLAAYFLCGVGILLHVLLIIYFTNKFIFKFDINQVFPSYFVVYVGIAVFSVVAPVFNAAWLGKILFWFGFIAYLILLPIIIYRVVAIKSIPEQLLPTITIFAAPASLCLAGYINSFQEKSLIIICLLTSLSLVMLLGVLLYMPKMIKWQFFPGYSAFTFPFVISAIAIKALNNSLIWIPNEITIIKYLVYSEELLATLFVMYVLVRYIGFYSSRISEIKKELVKCR